VELRGFRSDGLIPNVWFWVSIAPLLRKRDCALLSMSVVGIVVPLLV